MSQLRNWPIAAALYFVTLTAQAQVNQAHVWASACASCHGTQGHALPGYASLAGQTKDELIQKIIDFKSGRTPATLMHQIAKGYSDEQIEQIAAYFAAQKPLAKQPS